MMTENSDHNMNSTRRNWSLLQQMSYETNKRLRKQALRKQKLRELEEMQERRILDERRMHRQQQLKYLRNKFHHIKRAQSECSLRKEDSDSIVPDYKSILPSKWTIEFNGKRNLKPCGCSSRETSRLLDKTLDLLEEEANSNKIKVLTKSSGSNVPVGRRSRIPHLKRIPQPNYPNLSGLRRSQSASELFCLDPSRSNSTRGSPCGAFGDCAIPVSKVDQKDSSNRVLPDSKFESPFVGVNVESSRGPIQTKSSEEHPSSTLDWLRTGTPPLLNSNCTGPVDQSAQSVADLTVRVTRQAPAAEFRANCTVPVVCTAPIHAVANNHHNSHHNVVSVPVERLNFEAIPNSANTITPIPSPSTPKVSSNLHFVVPRSHIPNEMFHHNPMPSHHIPQVSHVSPRSNDPGFSTINSNYFFTGKPISISVGYPYSALEDPKTCVATAGRTNVASPENGTTKTSGLDFQNGHLTTERYSRPESVEVVIKNDAQVTKLIPINCSNTPLKSILKPRPSTVQYSPERLPGFHDNFSELRALRTRDSMELAPIRLRLGTAPEYVTVPRRDPSPEAADSSETDRSGSPRSQRKTVRFADQLGSRPVQPVISNGPSVLDDSTSVSKLKPVSPSTSTSLNTVKSDGPIISVILPNCGQDNTAHPSTSYDAPIRNTILPSLGHSSPFCPVSFPPRLPDSSQTTDFSVNRETKIMQPDCTVGPDDRLKYSTPLGKPPIQPQSKGSASARYHRSSRPGYAELLVGRPRRLLESNVALGMNNNAGCCPATVNLIPSPIVLDKATESTPESLCTSPSAIVSDRVSPIHLKIPSLRSVSGPPAFRRTSRDPKSPTPTLVNTTKLNELTRTASEPRNTTLSRIVTQQEVHIPSAFNPVRLSCSSSTNEAENLAVMTRLTELNYETSMTTTDPSLTLPSVQSIPILPDYEGVDAELSEKLRMQQRKQAFQHAIYLSGQANMNHKANRYASGSNPTSASDMGSVNHRADHAGANLVSMASSARSSPCIGIKKRGKSDRIPCQNRPTHADETNSLSLSGRLLNRRPRVDGLSRDSSIQVTVNPANSTISNAYTLERHGLTLPSSGRNVSSCSTANGLQFNSPSAMSEFTSTGTNNTAPHSKSLGLKCTTLPRISSRTEEYDNEGEQQQLNFMAHIEPASVDSSTKPEWISSGLVKSGPNVVPTVSDSYDKVSDSLAEFIESERISNQADESIYESPKLTHCSRPPVYTNRSNSKRRTDTTSTMSMEEARLLKSLERLNNRLCDILSDR